MIATTGPARPALQYWTGVPISVGIVLTFDAHMYVPNILTKDDFVVPPLGTIRGFKEHYSSPGYIGDPQLAATQAQQNYIE